MKALVNGKLIDMTPSEEQDYIDYMTEQEEIDANRDLGAEELFAIINGNSDGNKSHGSFLTKQIRHALELFVQSLTDDSTAMEVADVFPEWIKDNHTYKEGERFRWGTDIMGDTQIWQVLQNHTSQPNWTPDTAVSLYKRIGITDGGVAIYTKPLGSSDAYMTGDRAMFDDGHIRKSVIDNNVWDYIEYPAGWVIDD